MLGTTLKRHKYRGNRFDYSVQTSKPSLDIPKIKVNRVSLNDTSLLCVYSGLELVQLLAFNKNKKLLYRIKKSQQGHFSLIWADKTTLNLNVEQLKLTTTGFAFGFSYDETLGINLIEKFIFQEKNKSYPAGLNITRTNLYLFSGLKILSFYRLKTHKQELGYINEFKGLLNSQLKKNPKDLPATFKIKEIYRFWGDSGRYIDYSNLANLHLPLKFGRLPNTLKYNKNFRYSPWDSLRFCIIKNIFKKNKLSLGGF